MAAIQARPVLAIHVPDLLIETWHMRAEEFGAYCLSVFEAARESRWDDIGHPFRITSKGLRRPAIRLADRNAVLSVGACAHCESTENLTVDHIVPLARGGKHERANFQCLCFPCNRRKYTRLEEELG